MRRLAVPILLAALLAGCGRETVKPAPAPGPGRAVSFPAADGVALAGTLFGEGETAVVLSNMGDNDPGPWQEFAPLLADRGYAVLTYSFRYPWRTNSFSRRDATGTVPDLLGAVAFVRRSGATHLVLVGASLGGITVGKVAATAGAEAVIILSAGQDLARYGLGVSARELAALTMPKLFVASEEDTITGLALTRSFYERAPQPKELKTYPGGVHGVHLFDTGDGDDLRRRVLDFVVSHAPPG